DDIETLHLIAMPLTRKLTSVRDLTSEHLELLKSIRDYSYRAIEKTFGLPKHKVRAFFHYHPTFYHLHVHFAHVNRIEKVGAFLGRGLLLEDIIENIEMKGDYYQT